MTNRHNPENRELTFFLKRNRQKRQNFLGGFGIFPTGMETSSEEPKYQLNPEKIQKLYQEIFDPYFENASNEES